MKKTIYIIAAAALLGFYFFKDASTQFTSSPLPHLNIPLLNNEALLLTRSALPEDEPYLVNIFASWCSACLYEHQTLLKIQQEELALIYGIGWLDSSENLFHWLQQQGNPYEEVGVDEEGTLSEKFDIEGVPQTLVVYKNEIFYRHAGTLDDYALQYQIRPLLQTLKKKEK